MSSRTMQEEPTSSEVQKEEFRTKSLAEAILTPDGLTTTSPFQHARLDADGGVGGDSKWNLSPITEESSQGRASEPLPTHAALASPSTLPPGLRFWTRSGDVPRLVGGQNQGGSSFTFIGALSVYRNPRYRSTYLQDTGNKTGTNQPSGRTLSFPSNSNSVFTACFRGGRLPRSASQGSERPQRIQHRMEEPDFGLERGDGFFDEEWESRKTCFVSIRPSSSDELRTESCPAALPERPPERVSSLERLYNKVFGIGNAEFCTRLSLPVNRDAQTRASVFPKTVTGADFELSDVAYNTAMEFNGVWKAQSGGKEVHRALAAMSRTKRGHKTCGGGVRYLLIDSTRSHFRTSTWTNATEHKEQRPWNEDTVCTTEKSRMKGHKQLSVKLSGSSIEAKTRWTGGMQAQLTQKYTLSPDLRRLKVVYTMEKINNVNQNDFNVSSRKVQACMVHTMIFRRQS